MGRLFLPRAGATHILHTQDQETVIDVLSGTCAMTLARSTERSAYEVVGQRSSPFDGPPTMVYIPRGMDVTITCTAAPLHAVLVSVPSRSDTAPALITPEDVSAAPFGRNNWQRSVYPSVGLDVQADRIMMGETHTPSGNWSSYPPHKHDEDNPPEEVLSEEIYHFLIDPPHGFGMQRLWTAPGHPEPINEAYPLRDGDTVAIPRGYHPTVVAPGFRMVTVWAYAGDERSWGGWAPDSTFAELLEEE
jgi:5-deoxy-glucuronate isomerase